MNEKDAVALLVKCGCSPDIIEHCKTVAEYARKIASNIKKCAEKKGQSINIDIDAVFLGGLLHDIPNFTPAYRTTIIKNVFFMDV